jgi:four helix bundle protein
MQSFSEWLATVPETITGDPLWKMKVYRLALFLGDLAWHDVTKLVSDRRTAGLADQLFRAIGSIGANIAEGYSRQSGKDRARFYEYALGSTRESRHWYYQGRHILSDKVAEHRINLLAEIARLLLSIIPQERVRNLAEEPASYEIDLVALLDDPPLPP